MYSDGKKHRSWMITTRHWLTPSPAHKLCLKGLNSPVKLAHDFMVCPAPAKTRLATG